jgi:CheY-like chemotaxis protein
MSAKPTVLIVDDDDDLIIEARKKLEPKGFKLIASPEIEPEISEIEPRLPETQALVLDLSINGSIEAGLNILAKLEKKLRSGGVPVIIWSKYLIKTHVYDAAGGGRTLDDQKWGQLSDSMDGDLIKKARRRYAAVRGFVSKQEPEPIDTLEYVLGEIGVAPKTATAETSKA